MLDVERGPDFDAATRIAQQLEASEYHRFLQTYLRTRQAQLFREMGATPDLVMKRAGAIEELQALLDSPRTLVMSLALLAERDRDLAAAAADVAPDPVRDAQWWNRDIVPGGEPVS